MPRVVSLFLPTWSTDRIRRQLAAAAPPAEAPLVLIGRDGRRGSASLSVLAETLLTHNTLKTHQDFAKCFTGRCVAGKSRDRSRITLRYQWSSAHLRF